MGELELPRRVDEASVQHADHPIGPCSVRQRMRHHHDGGPGARQLRQHLHHGFAVGGVEVSRGLVRQDHPGVTHQRARHGNALLLTTRQLARHVLCAMCQAYLLQRCRHAPASFRTGHTPVRQRDIHILRHVQVIDEIEILEHEPDSAAPAQRELLLGIPGDVLTHEPVGAFGGRVDQPQDVQQRRLATTGRAHHGKELALLHFQ
jgi:hypothetical protein